MIDLFSRRVIGPFSRFERKPLPGSGSMQGRTYADLPLQALPMAVWRRKPKTKVQVHSPSRGFKTNRCRATDQGSQFTGYEWQEFLEQHNLTQSMSRRGNCWDNAVAESLFNLLKRERIRRRKYKTGEGARQDVFALRRLQAIAYRPKDYIEFSTTHSANTLETACCHRSPSNSSRN